MSNREWMQLIAKEFNVSNTVAKGMLSAMYKAKRILSINKDIRRQRQEQERKEDEELKMYAMIDYEDNIILCSKRNKI